MMLAFLSSILLGSAGAGSFKPPKHADGVTVVDHAAHDLPPVRVGERVIDLMSGQHFDDLLQDTPDELRPPSLILFAGFKTCGGKANWDAVAKFKQLAETVLPSRERLMIAMYDMDAAPVRAWYEFTPEMDLKKRMGVTKCHELVFVPRSCDGFTKWCEEPSPIPDITFAGCDRFTDACGPTVVRRLDTTAKGGENYVPWVLAELAKEGEPQISPVFGTYHDQGQWILQRDETTTDNILRNYFLVESFPAFTTTGYLAMPIPDEMKKWFLDFYERRKRSRATEQWHAASTQMSFHETKTTFVSMDQEAYMRDKMANEIIKPIVAKWSGIEDLELTSFYGIREYQPENWLRNHIDRIETHVLSVTFSLGKLDPKNPDRILTEEEEKQYESWPIEVVSWDGKVHRHPHRGGYMLLYESSKLIHGRPYHNKGPAHLGAFVHFKPHFKNAKDASAWERIADEAKRNQQANQQRGYYKSTPSQEPANPVFSAKKYGEDTGFSSSTARAAGGGGGKKSKPNPDSVAVKFKNNAERPLLVAWQAPDGSHVEQGMVSPGATLQINSYVGHRFVWLETESRTPVPNGAFEVERGSSTYSYGTTKVSR